MDLQKWIMQHPDVLLEEKRIRAIFCDAFQNDMAKVNLLLTAYREDIVASMRQSYPWTPTERTRYIKVLEQNYSVVSDRAVWAVDTWSSLFSQKVIDSLVRLENEAAAAEELLRLQELEKMLEVTGEDEEPEYELTTRSDREDFYINPSLDEKDDRIYVPCGVGETDNGFFIYGIKKSNTCVHPQADVFALVYNYLIRSSTITNEDIPSILNKVESLHAVDYRSVLRIAICLLQLVKNNYIKNGVLELAFRGDVESFKYAVSVINHYAALFSRLMGIPEVKLSVKSNKTGIPFNLDGNDGVFVRNNTELITNARELWYGKRINYRFTKANLPDLEYLLREISPYTYFKEGQFDALCSMVSARKHMVCIMPTGSGKSLIYYMVSILQPLPIFIIAPTDILIKDQIRNLKQIHRIDNVAHLQLTEDNDFDEYQMRNSLNYLTPTTLQNRNLLVLFRYINKGCLKKYYRSKTQGKMLREEQISNYPLIANIVLDEIHCLSNWGHDFRPEYLMLSKYLNKFLDQITFLGFTATANYTVVEDVHKQLGIPQENFISPISFEKHNISYDYRCLQTTEQMLSEVKEICERLTARNERTLIFTKSDELSRQVADAVGWEADIFTSDNPEAYHHFVDGKCRVLVSNEELGVGINFPNIRNIIHFGLPLSKSEYVQEVGRAGRASEQVSSYVLYLDSESGIIPADLLKRSTPIEAIPTMLEGLENDYADIYRKLTNNCPTKEVLFEQLIAMFKDFTERKSALYVETYGVDELYLAKQKLYMLYVTGYVNDWYAYKKSKNTDGVDILIDIYSSGAEEYRKDPQKLIRRMKKRLRDYFDEMGGDRESLARTDRAKSEDEIIKVYVDWYYIKYLYHHNEQFLDLLEFVINNTNGDREEITAAIKDYFTLPFIKLKSDEAIYSEMSIQEIADKVVAGVGRATITNIERINTNRYSYRLDYLLFCSNLRYSSVFELSRLERVLNNVSKEEAALIGNAFPKLYKVCDVEGKLHILNFLDSNGSVFGIKQADFVRTVYADGVKDIIYYGIMANAINPVFADGRR